MSEKQKSEHLMLIDGYGLIYRSYFVFVNRPLTDPQGNNVSAVYGFFRTLFSLMQQYQPDRVAVAMDSKVPTFRHQLFEPYKAQRDKTPEELHSQIPIIESILEKAGVQCISADGYEADDIIATIARDCSNAGYSCTIVSNDKDLLQLVDDQWNITALRYEQKSYVRYTAETVRKQFQIEPSQMIDFLTIVGDSSDNIPGIKGIGAKGAVELLTRYGDFDAIIAHKDSLTQAQRKKIEEGIDSAQLSKDLVTLRYVKGLGNAEIGSIVPRLAWEQTADDFQKIGAKTLVEQAKGFFLPGQSGGKTANEGNTEIQQRGRYRVITSLDSLDDVLRDIRQAGIFALDVETDSLDEMHARLVGCSIAVTAGEGWYIPLLAEGKPMLPEEKVHQRLKELLENPGMFWIGQNCKYDMKVLSRWGISIEAKIFDTMIAGWLLDSGSGAYSMDALAQRYLGYKPKSYAEVVPKGKTFSDVPLEDAAEYAAEDADVTLRLYHHFSQLLSDTSLETVMYKIEMPLVRILSRMELRGVCLLPKLLEEYSRELDEKLKHIEQRVFELCGKEFNINSTKQLQEVLFKQRGLKPIKKTKTGHSTDTSVLEILAQEDEVPRQILEHRVLSKLKSTYVDTLPALINPETGRIHTSYTQTGTATGRLSSRNPNLQNIPIRTEEGRKIRRAFVPQQGYTLISADYSQIELVILAHLADDPGLKEAFLQGRDVHRHTASLIFQVPIDAVTPEQRRAAKTINFGVMYGMSSFRLSRELSIPRNQADQFIDAYFKRYSGIRQFIDRTVQEAERQGEVKTLMGRTRPIPGITSKNRLEQTGAQRIAVNTPIQGSAADIMKLAMIKIEQRIAQEHLRARMLMQIHDEIILEAPHEEIEPLKQLLQEEMERVVSLQVPLHVSIEAGDSWGDMH